MTFDEDLAGVADQAIIEAATRFRRGLVEGQSLEFAPPSAMFCTEARRIAELLPYRNRQTLPAPDHPGYDKPDPRAKARLRLKLPMYRYALANGLLDKLAEANASGLDAMIELASGWGVPIPEGLYVATNDEWHSARNRAQMENDRNPPPFMRRRAAAGTGEEFDYGH